MDLRRALLGRDRTLLVWLILATVVLLASIYLPSFRTLRNVQNLLEQSVVLGIASLGQTLVIVTGGIDVSVGSVISAVVTFLSVVMHDAWSSIALSVAGAILLGATVGAANGLGVAYLRLSPLMVTLSTMSFLQGIALQLRPWPGGTLPYQFTEPIMGSFGPFPLGALGWLVLLAAAFYLLHRTIFGHYLYAVGGGERAAHLSAIPVRRVKFTAYLLSGISAALAGLYMAARVGSGDPLVGVPFGLDSITAVVLGGADIFGGRGTMLGTVAGVFLLSLLSDVLNLAGVSSFYQYILKGAMLIVAVLLYSRKWSNGLVRRALEGS